MRALKREEAVFLAKAKYFKNEREWSSLTAVFTRYFQGDKGVVEEAGLNTQGGDVGCAYQSGS